MVKPEEKVNMVQIRMWQDIDFLIVVVDDTDISKLPNTLIFYLTKEQMLEELNKCNSGAAHQTKESNKNNINVEMSIRFKKNSSHYNRWYEKYYRFDLVNILNRFNIENIINLTNGG